MSTRPRSRQYCFQKLVSNVAGLHKAAAAKYRRPTKPVIEMTRLQEYVCTLKAENSRRLRDGEGRMTLRFGWLAVRVFSLLLFVLVRNAVMWMIRFGA
jgi:hypothetical protein